MKIKNITKNITLANNCKVANNLFTRFLGLMGKDNLPEGSGLIIIPCNSIHMCFMKFPIDVVFLDASNTVIYITEDIKPWKLSRIIMKAHSVLELPSGTSSKTKTEIGDKLILEE